MSTEPESLKTPCVNVIKLFLSLSLMPQYKTKLSLFGTTTFNIMTFGIMTFSIMTFSITTFSITTCSIMAFSITTLSIKSLYVTFSISDTEHKKHLV